MVTFIHLAYWIQRPAANGVGFLPDPSIGRWAQWRQPVGSAAFSLIGQIHTLSTPAALGHLQDLVTDLFSLGMH